MSPLMGGLSGLCCVLLLAASSMPSFALGKTLHRAKDIAPHTQCSFESSPAFPFYWDEDGCKAAGVLGCKADGISVQCRFCGEPPYQSIQCPDPMKDAHHIKYDIPHQASWIVVGGGAAGCAAAAALADAGEEVLLLERGVSDLEVPATQQAGTWPYVVNTEAAQHIRWEDGVWGTAAKVLGGGTSINGGYSFEEAPDYLTKAFGPELDLDAFYESSKFLADDLAHPIQPNQFGIAWKEALCTTGFGCADQKTPSLRWKEGAWVPFATMNSSKRGWPRRGSAALIHERSHLKNLRVQTSATVHRILFDGTRAVGVAVSLSADKPAMNVSATKGVILAAGAIFTPQLLQLSGIGQKDLLNRLGVQPVVPELPVGRNFIDRLVMNLALRSAKKMPLSIGYVVAMNTTLNMTIEWGHQF
mmetsp:Transcript_88043/g.158722  ORF Transcript_88043/g.158722 Transcript_88043/m.158722 type:complete len:416 (+) Transcript_88043:56-1303(+)